MDLTEDAFRALARSSPWRWRTLHFLREHRASEPVEAWVRRPGELVVRLPSGREDRVDDRTDHVLRFAVGASARAKPVSLPPLARRWPHEVDPQLRADGLVAVRPDGWDIRYGDPMWDNYEWAAMLDPVELSSSTTVTDLREDVRQGRRTWRARMAAQEGYDPTCGCCPLLWSWISDRDELAGSSSWPLDPVPDYPDAYDVALDVQTGVVVSRQAIGGGRDNLGFELTLLDVDGEAG